MKSYLALAWKELKAQKITAILILVAVIMSTIMTTVIGQSIGILQSMRIQQAAGLNGNRYATFHQLGKEQAQKLHEDDRLYDVGDTIFIGSTPLGNSSLSLYLREYHDNALSMYPAIGNVKEGRLPEEAIEIALSEDALQYLGLDAVIGDTVSLDLSVSVMDGSLSELEYSADFVLTGILESSYIGYASGTVEGIVGEGTAEELLPEETLRSFRGAYIETAQQLRKQRETGKDYEVSPQVEDLDFEFVLFASAVIDYDYIMGLIARYTNSKNSKQRVTKEQLISLVASSANLIDERDDIREYIDSLDEVNGKTEQEIKEGYEAFKVEKYAKQLASIADKHGITADSLRKFVEQIMERMIFDGEKLSDLLAPLELGWKARTKAELALMDDLVPLLKRLAAGREISGLSAYED